MILGMLWLLACAPRPTLELPIAPAPARNAVRFDAGAFVGPLGVAGLDRPCGEVDRAALLHEGRYGWRVLLVGPEGLHPHDAGVRDLPARVGDWIAADEALSRRCGEPRTSPVLLAIDRDARPDSLPMSSPAGLGALEVWALVEDPAPGDRRPPPDAPTGPSLTMFGAPDGWEVLSDDPAALGSRHDVASRGASRVAQEGHPRTYVPIAPTMTWAAWVEGLDALAGVGVTPDLALAVGGGAPAPGPPGRTTRLTLGRPLAALPVRLPDPLGPHGVVDLLGDAALPSTSN